MLERTLCLALAVLVPLTAACSSLQTREYAPGEIPVPDSEHRIVAVTRTSGERIDFDREQDGRPAPLPRVAQEAVVGPVDGEPVRVDLADTRTISIEERDDHLGRTLLLVGGVGLAVIVVVGMAKWRGGLGPGNWSY